MASKFSRVNGRGHRSLDATKCEQCKVTYNTHRLLDDEQVCYKCLGHTMETWTELKIKQLQAKYGA